MLIVKNEDEVEDFLENSINAGCEGLMLKTPNAPFIVLEQEVVIG